jgi:putative exosortase-associated protein (TIGR04073 family)
MKTLYSLLLAGVLLAGTAAQAAEPTGSYLSRIGEKFGTGLVNVATGYVEIPKGIYVQSLRHGVAAGIPVGLVKGLFQTLGRTGTGVVEMATFYIPTKPMIQAPLVWENFDQETTYSTNWEMYNTR